MRERERHQNPEPPADTKESNALQPQGFRVGGQLVTSDRDASGLGFPDAASEPPGRVPCRGCLALSRQVFSLGHGLRSPGC